MSAPCDDEDIPHLSLSLAPDIVTIRCREPKGESLWTHAFRVADGSRAWVSNPEHLEAHPRLESRRHSERTRNVVVEWGGKKGLLALDALTGRELWRAESENDGWSPYVWNTLGLVEYIPSWNAEDGSRLRVVDATTGATVFESHGLVVCRLPHSIYMVEANDFFHVDLGAAEHRETKIPSDTARDSSSCGSRKGQTFCILWNHDTGLTTLAVVDNEGGITQRLTVGRSFLRPAIFDRERPLPRYFPVVGVPDDLLHIVDLDAMKVDRSVSFRPEAAGSENGSLSIRARAGNRWLGVRAHDVFAVDGEDGRLLAASGLEPFYDWGFLRGAIAGDVLLLPRDDGGRTLVAPVDFTARATP